MKLLITIGRHAKSIGDFDCTMERIEIECKAFMIECHAITCSWTLQGEAHLETVESLGVLIG